MLATFAKTGQPPSLVELQNVVGPDGVDAARVLTQLHEGDFLRLDATGEIRAAYPFSAFPTPHLVQIEGGPQVHAMCAIDALSVAPMLDVAVTVGSTDPTSGQPITVRVAADGTISVWEPPTAVVFVGQQTDGSCCDPTGPSAAADMCCGYVNFFRSRAQANAWASSHPTIQVRCWSSPRPCGLAGRSSDRY